MNELGLRKVLKALDIDVVKHINGWLMAECPFAAWTHAKGYDRRPSFGIKINAAGLSGYKCFTCGEKGTVASLVNKLSYYRKKNYMTLLTEVDYLESKLGFGDFEQLNCIKADNTLTPLNQASYKGIFPDAMLDKVSANYLASRGISQKTCEKLGLLYDEKEARVLFPVKDENNELYGFSGRLTYNSNTLPKVKDYYGLPKRSMLLGAERYTPGKPIIVVEGLFAYAHLIDIGVENIANVVAIMGSQLTNEKLSILLDWNESVYLLLDNDAGGDAGLFGALGEDGEHKGGGAVDKLRGHVPLYVPLWPEGKYDPDQLTYKEVECIINSTDFYY